MVTRYLQRTTSAAPLTVFRIVLGLLLFAGVVRFWYNGWIEQLYIQPAHYFPFYGFEFIKPLGSYTYVLFFACGLCALLVAIGLFYRIAAIGLFLSFTYIELIDKSTYLNHYYFISMICLLMIFLPANVYFSVDAYRKRNLQTETIPLWCLDSVKVFVAFLYFFAGLAKVNSDWLLQALPLRIWLPAKNDLPFIGSLFNHLWIAYAFSWIGCLYDLVIPFLLFKKQTRLVAYAAVIVFHVLTSILFPIGMFPYIMIATALIFFSAKFHKRIISIIAALIRARPFTSAKTYTYPALSKSIVLSFLIVFFAIQLILPFRYMAYPGELFWTEEGYRFSWRVMLMEKAGHAQFVVKDVDGRFEMVQNKKFLTPLQEKMMATQPDMILQYAHILRDHYKNEGFKTPQVYVESYVSVNGRLSKPYINSLTNLAEEKESFAHKPWILPFDHDIQGF
jgi:hypothetical protein